MRECIAKWYVYLCYMNALSEPFVSEKMGRLWSLIQHFENPESSLKVSLEKNDNSESN